MWKICLQHLLRDQNNQKYQVHLPQVEQGKKLKEVLDSIKCHKRNLYRSKKPCEPNPKFTFCCDPHGYIKPLNSNGCENKKNFHDDSATFSTPNPKLCIIWNEDFNMGPGS